jgi:hypothetical protein
MIGRVSCSSFGDAIKKIQATQLEYDLYGDFNLEAVKRFLSEKKDNDECRKQIKTLKEKLTAIGNMAMEWGENGNRTI